MLGELAPLCEKIEVAGSIRRQRPFVNDIDLVLIPKNQGVLAQKLYELGCRFGGPKLQRFTYKGIPVDIYIASPQTWATLLLIRTGSTRHNKELCSLARRRGWQLKANGEGLVDSLGKRVAGESEEAIFKALNVPYQEPWERE